MKIGILITGHPPEDTIDQHGTYADAFERLLAGHNFEFANWACLEGEFPESVNDADGWLLTGSKFGAYEDLPWIATLEDFIRSAYSKDIPLVGICFGHQILAQALGGKVVKFDGGWSVGRVEYNLEVHTEAVPLYAWHQDQVITAPDDARVVGSTPFCKNAALMYGDKAYSIQPHPEFSASFFNDLFAARKSVLPEEALAEAEASIADALPTESAVIAGTIATFFKARDAAGSSAQRI